MNLKRWWESIKHSVKKQQFTAEDAEKCWNAWQVTAGSGLQPNVIKLRIVLSKQPPESHRC